MKKAEIDVSVIIVNYKTSRLLVDAVDSIFEKTEDLSFEVIVVDNRSQDDSEQLVRERYGDRVIFLPLPENIGFGRANNEGIRIAKGRNILFLNPDTLLMNNAIGLLSDYLDGHPEAGAAGGNLYSPEGNPNVSFNRVFPSMFDETDQAVLRLLSRLRFGRNGFFNYTERPIEVGFIVGADLMVPRKILDRVGGFDPDFFMYYEETELCWRIRRAKYRIVCVPQARIVHIEGKSFTQSYDREKRSLVSRRIYFRKTHSRRYARWADRNYVFLTAVGLGVSRIFGLKGYRVKLEQRRKILHELGNCPV
ncbi:glycosyltransferase family 2 protein [uncultured Alistipes sp.]|uniref:glycosyltransferase family 2 protein n=1 Tax=uncultured Alistipes sp. TaxID=538949 RepID=UPI002603DE13|nr:glycosyltransferase family 2 protein [uncultured Alistipes sp.]